MVFGQNKMENALFVPVHFTGNDQEREFIIHYSMKGC